MVQGTYRFILSPKCANKTASFSYKNPITLEEIKQINLSVLQVEKLELEKISGCMNSRYKNVQKNHWKKCKTASSVPYRRELCELSHKGDPVVCL